LTKSILVLGVTLKQINLYTCYGCLFSQFLYYTIQFSKYFE